MPSTRHLGNISFIVAAGGYLAMEALLRQGTVSGSGWQIAAAGLEAATIGGAADWFAVTALFRRVPIPILSRHTDIIIKNRARLTENIVEMVETRWLTPEAIARKLADISFAEKILDCFSEPERQEKALALVRDLLARLTVNLDRPEPADFLGRILKENLVQADLGRPMGRWLEMAMAHQEHEAIWEALFRSLQENLKSPAARQVIRGMLFDAVRTYAPVLVRQADRPELLDFLEGVVRVKVQELDVAASLGAWTEEAIRSGSHHGLIISLLDALRKKIVTDPEVRSFVITAVEQAISGYGQEHPLAGFLAGFLIDRDDASSSIITAMTAVISDLQREPLHPLRCSFDQFLTQYAAELRQGESSVCDIVNEFKKNLAEGADLRDLLQRLLTYVKETVMRDIESDEPRFVLIDYDALAEVVIGAVGSLAKQVGNDKDHPLRARLNDVWREFASRLAAGEENAVRLVDGIKAHLLENADLRGLVARLLSNFKAALAVELSTNASPFMDAVRVFIKNMLIDLRSEPERRAALDAWLRQALVDLARRHHHLVGDIVRQSMAAIDDRELVAQIESKVGDDLQYIRLNGAIVGGVVGMVLAAIRLLFFGVAG